MSKKKILSLVLCVALVGAVSIGATLAYLTDSTDTITNTFTVGAVDITLTEDVEINGTVADPTDPMKIIPLDAVKKDPIITLGSASEDAWVFVLVENPVDLLDYITNESAVFGATNWDLVAWDNDGSKSVYAYKSPLSATDSTSGGYTTAPFEIDYQTTFPSAAGYWDPADDFEITFKAYAIQASGITSFADAYDLLKVSYSELVLDN
ncbi:MAG: M73 family metallopeptidase [Gracilibacteraceae bacterium]|jgi:predicted ribosomally synthesized peptide with SipW-like signal peptide|nr:M73 family metallopeptidase [Gracilibacteraceae bacterium]